MKKNLNILVKLLQIFFSDFADILGKYLDHLKMQYLIRPMVNKANQNKSPIKAKLVENMFRDLKAFVYAYILLIIK